MKKIISYSLQTTQKLETVNLTTIVSSGRLKEVGKSDGKSYEVVM